MDNKLGAQLKRVFALYGKNIGKYLLIGLCIEMILQPSIMISSIVPELGLSQ